MEEKSKDAKKLSRHKRQCRKDLSALHCCRLISSRLLLEHIKHWLYDDDESHLGLHVHSCETRLVQSPRPKPSDAELR